jgi:hypothetical protein
MTLAGIEHNPDCDVAAIGGVERVQDYSTPRLASGARRSKAGQGHGVAFLWAANRDPYRAYRLDGYDGLPVGRAVDGTFGICNVFPQPSPNAIGGFL